MTSANPSTCCSPSTKPTRRRPERLPLVLLCWAATGLAATAPEPLPVRGTTRAGMAFAGELLAVTASELTFRETRRGTPVMVGLPLESVQSLRLDGLDGASPGLLGPLEGALPLLPLWDGPTLAGLLRLAHLAAADGDWHAAWRWAARLEGALADPAPRLEAAILKAWALLELQLYPQAAAACAELAGTVDPMDAPARLCWVNARLARRAGDTAGALHWAHLPSLQIPAATGSLADELAALAAQLALPQRRRSNR